MKINYFSPKRLQNKGFYVLIRKIVPENKPETNTESVNQETLHDNPDGSTNEIKETTESEDTSDEIVTEEVIDKVEEKSDTGDVNVPYCSMEEYFPVMPIASSINAGM